jgi:glycosyltransferase involved in cell wall biosynthesis
MKILQVITLCELGGAQSVVVNLSNNLSKKHDVMVVAGDGDGKMWGLLSDRVKTATIPSLKKEISLVDEFKTIKALRQIYKEFKPDIIHLHSSKAGVLGRVAFPKRKIIYTVHGFDSIRVAHKVFLPIEKILQYRCAAIIGVSEYDRINLLSSGITRNVSVVHNGIYAPQKTDNIPDSLKYNGRKKVACIARLSPQKNHQLFIDISRVMPQYDFYWIGNQKDVSTDYPKNCFFLGSIPNASSLLHYIDLLILTSNYEGLPMVIIEALAASKPVVSSNVGGVNEIVRDGIDGYAVANSVNEFSDKISYILDNEEVASVFGKNGEKIYESELTVEKMTSNYLKIYHSICAH